ncbi:hypothetical protein BGW42_003318 [Actinomortierella wolfii]|nr:hypothetical protein BGW42_003318 [Actinomortierella wolfii]
MQQQPPLLPPSYSTPPPPSTRKGNNNNNNRGQPPYYHQQGRPSFNNNAQSGGVGASSSDTTNNINLFHQQYQQSTQAGAAAASALTATLLNQHQAPQPSGGDHNGGSVPWYSSYQPPSVDQRLAVSRAMAAGMHGGSVGAASMANGGVGGNGGSTPGAGATQPGMFNTPNLPFYTAPRQQQGQSYQQKPLRHHNASNPYQRHQPNHRNQRGKGRGGGSSGSGRGGFKGSNQNRTQQQQSKSEEGSTGTGGDSVKTSSEDATSTTGLRCVACNITFNNEPAMKTHLAAHVKCPDCSFTASPGHVSNHRKTAHGPNSKPSANTETSSATSKTASQSTSQTKEHEDDDEEDDGSEDEEAVYLRNKATQAQPKSTSKYGIATPSLAMYERHPLTPTFKTEEDIKNWIAERRKNWPTAENIQRKEEERQEMIAKGQIPPGDAQAGNNKKNATRQQRQQLGKKRANESQTDPKNDADQTTAAKKPKTDAADATARSGSGLVAYASSSDEQSEAEDESKSQAQDQPQALEAGESDNEDMDPVRDAVTSKDPTSMGKILLPGDRPVNRRHCKYFARGKCTRGDKCTFIHDPSMVKNTPIPSKKKETFRNRKSLLEMLLASEIKEEKNKLLEALRYIVENNFFDKIEPIGPLVQEIKPPSTVSQ